MLSGLALTQMCSGDELVALVAYDLATGAFRWAACSTNEQARRSVLEATSEVVYVDEVVTEQTMEQRLIAYDVVDGTELPTDEAAESQPTLSDVITETPAAVVDGIRLEGGQLGQDAPTSAIDDSTGEVLWTQPGGPVYAGVWAVSDGAVYVYGGEGGRLVAYELTTGDVRWAIAVYGHDAGMPWYAENELLFAMWTNLAVISTDDGSTIWRTNYSLEQFPVMTGVRANADTVFVAFSWTGSGGD
jgi:outer membrane protein assembly factor BamB